MVCSGNDEGRKAHQGEVKLYHFRLNDPSSDRGTIDTVILAVSFGMAQHILHTTIFEKGRTDLDYRAFVLVRAYPLSEIVYSNMEEAVR